MEMIFFVMMVIEPHNTDAVLIFLNGCILDSDDLNMFLPERLSYDSEQLGSSLDHRQR